MDICGRRSGIGKCLKGARIWEELEEDPCRSEVWGQCWQEGEEGNTGVRLCWKSWRGVISKSLKAFKPENVLVRSVLKKQYSECNIWNGLGEQQWNREASQESNIEGEGDRSLNRVNVVKRSQLS